MDSQHLCDFTRAENGQQMEKLGNLELRYLIRDTRVAFIHFQRGEIDFLLRESRCFRIRASGTTVGMDMPTTAPPDAHHNDRYILESNQVWN
jgi:hypothetical protein